MRTIFEEGNFTMNIEDLDNGIYKVAGEITIFNVSEFHELLKELSNSGKDKIYLDMSEITSIDTSGIQVILAFKKTGIRCNKDFRVIKPSDEVRKSLKIIGVM